MNLSTNEAAALLWILLGVLTLTGWFALYIWRGMVRRVELLEARVDALVKADAELERAIVEVRALMRGMDEKLLDVKKSQEDVSDALQQLLLAIGRRNSDATGAAK